MGRFSMGGTKSTLVWNAPRWRECINAAGYADIWLTPEVSRDLYLAAAF